MVDTFAYTCTLRDITDTPGHVNAQYMRSFSHHIINFNARVSGHLHAVFNSGEVFRRLIMSHNVFCWGHIVYESFDHGGRGTHEFLRRVPS
jgi:hypothetical protein